jgi:cell division protein FtsW (lipid II flippase)
MAATAALLTIGIFSIYSVGHPTQESPASHAGDFAQFWEKQIVFAILGIVAFVAVNLLRYRRLGEISYWIYGFVLVLLGILLLGKAIDIPFIPEINGTHRWIRFTIAGRELPAIQPSEIFKLAYIIALCWYLRYRSNYRSFKALIGPFVLTLIPIMLIILEPDLGTVMLMMPVLFVMIFVAGARIKHLLLIILLATITSPLLWVMMQPYQRKRISSVVLQNPTIQQQAQKHPKITKKILGSEFNKRLWDRKYGYQLERSKLAIASGGSSGRGYRQGPFIKYDFLPERINDFVFAAIAHQWGFAGSLTVILLFLIIIICGLEISNHNTDPFGRLLALGITVTFAVQVIVNISMTLGLMPITGLTLPLVSYGGSSLLTSLTSIGILNNIGRARPFSVAPKLFV